jgi:hypothetical protein
MPSNTRPETAERCAKSGMVSDLLEIVADQAKLELLRNEP